MKSLWKHLKSESKYKDNILEVEHRTFEFARHGGSMPFTILKTNDWVLIIPVDNDGNLVMVEQYRPAVDDVTLEFPGGGVNKGEDFDIAALRELREETGYDAEKLIKLGELRPNPAIMSNICHVYMATGCTQIFDTEFDPFEDIEVKAVSEEQLKYLIRRNSANHSIVLAAYSMYLCR